MQIASHTNWTVRMLAALPDDGNRYEIIDGELFVTPAPTFRHQDAVEFLYRLLFEYVEAIGQVIKIAPCAVTFSGRTEVQPDLFVLPRQRNGKRPAKFSDVGVLTLAVETSSPGTGHVDRHRKRELYQREDVPEYWIVDVANRTIDRWRPADTSAERLTRRLEWQPVASVPALVIDLEDYFRRVRDE